MDAYKLITLPNAQRPILQRVRDAAWIPFDPGNIDCQQFLGDAKNGATVTNGDGTAWTYSDDVVRALGLKPL